MIYKPEHVVYLENGAIVHADVRPGTDHDTADLTEKELEAEAGISEVMGADKNTEWMELPAAEKGHFKREAVCFLTRVGIDTAINNPQRKRRLDQLSQENRAALEAA